MHLRGPFIGHTPGTQPSSDLHLKSKIWMSTVSCRKKASAEYLPWSYSFPCTALNFDLECLGDLSTIIYDQLSFSIFRHKTFQVGLHGTTLRTQFGV
jgi:hypothetical protein